MAADVRDPYVALLLADGSAALLEADPEARRLNPLSTGDAEAAAAAALRPAADADGIAACSLYDDTCGWLRQAVVGVAADVSDAAAEGATYCLVCRVSGAVELFALPSWQPVFASAGLADGPPLLFSGSSAGAVDPGEGPGPPVVEARLVSFGPVGAGRSDAAAGRASGTTACLAPLLLALTADHQLLAYKAFSWPSSASGGGSAQLRFRRMQLDVPPLLPPAAAASAAGVAPPLRLQRLHCFEGMGEEIPFSGVFVAGEAWARLAGCAMWPCACTPCCSRLSFLTPMPHPTPAHPCAISCRACPCRAAPALAYCRPGRPAGAPPPPAAACSSWAGSAGGRWLHPFSQCQLPLGLHPGHRWAAMQNRTAEELLHCHLADPHTQPGLGCLTTHTHCVCPAALLPLLCLAGFFARDCSQAARAAASRSHSCQPRHDWTRPGPARCARLGRPPRA